MNLRSTSCLAILTCLLCASTWAQSGDVSPAYLVASIYGQQREHSVCYNQELDQYLVAYMDVKTGCSVPEISAYRLDGNGNRIGTEITIEPCNTGAGSTNCAYNSINDEYLVTFIDYNGWSWAQRIDATNGNLKGSNVLVDYTIALDPDLAYSPTSNRYLLAWRDDRFSTIDVRGALIDGSTGQPVGSQIVFTTFTTSIVGNPEIAYNSDLNEFVVVSQVVVEPQTELYAQRVSASTGAIVGSSVRITNSNEAVEWNDGIVYDPDNDRYLLTYECLNTYDIWGQFLGSGGSPTGGRFRINPSGLHGGATQVAWHPRAKEFLVTWQDSASSGNYARRVTSAGVPIGEAMQTNGTVAGFGNWAPLPVVNTGSGDHDYLVCWQNEHTDVYTSRVTLRKYVTSSSPNGAYRAGQMVDVQVTFDRAVYVTGTPQLALSAAPGSRADYVSGSGTTKLTFRYVVNQGDATPDLDYTCTSALSLNGGTIRDAASNDTQLTLFEPGTPGSLGYIEEAGRSAGVRIQGSITAGARQLVCLTGFRRTATNGEPYVEITALTPSANGSIDPVAATNSSCKTAMMEGLLVRIWGRVKPGSIGGASYVVSDGSDSAGVTVLTKAAPTVNEGDFVVITGIASRDGMIEL